MNTREDYNPLVSVGVLTYNSSKTVLETLESIKAQTYQNIELIISDDASKDNTVEICKEWVEKNKDRFVRCEILTVPENTGIPANANRRIAASRGEWSKGIAADDALLPDCIENFINYVKEHPEAEIIFAKFKVYVDKIDNSHFKQISDFRAKWFCDNFRTPQEQYRELIKAQCCAMLTMFARLPVLKRIKYDERFTLIEDYPMLLRLTKNNVRLYFMDKVACCYRTSGQSISSNKNDIIKYLNFHLKILSFKKEYIYPELCTPLVIYNLTRWNIVKIIKKLGLLENSSVLKQVLCFVIFYTISPHITLLKIRRKIKNIL